MSLEDEFKRVNQWFFADDDDDYLDPAAPVTNVHEYDDDGYSDPATADTSESEDDNDECLDSTAPDTNTAEDENRYPAPSDPYDDITSDFFAKPCCKRNCLALIPRDCIEKSRYDFMELEKAQQDLVILGKIESGRHNPAFMKLYDTCKRKKYGKRKSLPGSKGNVVYTYFQAPICRNLFLFLHDCGTKRYEALQHHFSNQGAVERVHGLKFKKSTNCNAVSLEQRQNVMAFITKFAERTALPLPGRLPTCKDFKIMKLPSHETKTSIYRAYIEVIRPELKVGNRSFRRIWNEHLPYISVMKPSTDLCDKCKGIYKIFLFVYKSDSVS